MRARLPLPLPLLSSWLCASLALALSTAAYALCAGPALRALFGGAALRWPSLLEGFLPTPPGHVLLRLWLPVALVAAAVIKAVSFYFQRVTLERIQATLRRRLRLAAVHHCWRLRPETLAAQGEARLTHLFTVELKLIEEWLAQALAPLVRDGAQALTLVITAVLIHPPLALLTVSVYPLLFWPIIRLSKRIRRASRESVSESASLHGLLHGLLRDHRELLLTGAEKRYEAALHEQEERYEGARLRVARALGLSPALTELSVALVIALSIGGISVQVSAGHWAAEHVISFFVAILLLYQPLKAISRALPAYEQGALAWETLQRFLTLPPELPEGGMPFTLIAPPTLRFEKLSLSYPDHPVLSHWSARCPAGGLYAFVGKNGAGKSSLFSAIARLMPFDEGEIWIDEYPLSRLSPTDFRASCAWLTQQADYGDDVPVFYENESLSEASLGEVNPELASLIGEGASQGERRRHRLETLFNQPPPLLILDEPEAYLDQENLTWLITQLERLRGECTILICSHEEKLLERCDLRFSLDHPEQSQSR